LNYIARGGKRSVSLLGINPDAKPIAVENLTLSRYERRFVSVLTQLGDGTRRFESKERQVLKSQVPLKLAAKANPITLDAETPGSYSYVVTDAAGAVYAKVLYQVAGSADLSRSLERNAELKLTLSKPDYSPGEFVEVQVQAPYVGAGLITIEREQVFSHVWFKADKTTSVQKIKLPEGIEGNAYLNVTFVRDPGSPEVFMSPLSYGVAPFSINLDKRKEPVTLKSPSLIKPGETATFELKTSKPSRAVVFAIDEGILQVARYKKPDAIGHFFQKRKLDVNTAQILDLVLPEFSKVMAAAPGGDAEGALGKHLNPFKKRRDLAIAYWSGIVDVGTDGKTLSWTVPERFNGSLKVFAVVVNSESIGVKEVQTTVRGDIVLMPNVPAVAAPGDENAVLSVSLAPVPQFTVIGEATQKVTVAEGREGIAYFRLKGADKLGEGSLVFTASGAAGGSTKTAKLTEYVSLRPATPYQHTVNVGMLRAGQSIDIALTRDMHSELRKLNASISHLPLGVATGLTAYLDSYAYSCTEQLVSKALPALVISGRPEFGTIRAVSSSNSNGAPVTDDAAGAMSAAEAIKILRARQTPEGSFGLWASNHHVDQEASLYAQLYLIEAAERKQAVPPDLIKNGNKFLRALAENTEGQSIDHERDRAMAVYMLTRQGQVTSTWVADVHRALESKYAKEWKQDIAAMYIAATYALLKQERLANDAKKQFPLTGKYPYSGMHSHATRTGQAMYLIAKHFAADLNKVNEAVYAELLEPLTRVQPTTYGSGWLLLAFDAIAASPNGIKPAIDSLKLSELDKQGNAKPRALPEALVPKVDVTAGTAKVRFENKGTLPAFYVVNQTGYDRAGTSAAKIEDNGMEIIREYVGKDGKAVSEVKLGDEIDVKLTFRSIGGRSSINDAAIVDLLPAGFEWVPAVRTAANEDQAALNTGNPNPCPTPRQQTESTEGNEEEQQSEQAEGNADCTPEGEQAEQPKVAWQPPVGVGGDWQPQYADARDDRIVLYGAVASNAQSFVYRIKATNKGKFTTPPAYAESMYDRTVKARSKVGAPLEVKGR
jgi:alpha-2-macroglobulin